MPSVCEILTEKPCGGADRFIQLVFHGRTASVEGDAKWVAIFKRRYQKEGIFVKQPIGLM